MSCGMGLKSKKFAKQSYKKCLQEAIDTGVPFLDQEFKATDSSVFSDRRFLSDSGVSRIVWKRPLELVRDPHLLFKEKVSHLTPVTCPSDLSVVNQIGPNVEMEIPIGFGPNQNLLTAGAAVAREKALAYRTFRGQLVPKDQFNFLHGIFKVFLSNWGDWIKIVIDDKLPSDGEKLVFSSSRCGTVFWVPLLEKALSKLYGSYESFAKHCTIADTFTHLTGSPVEIIPFASESEQNMFRLIVEELDKGSLLCILTQSEIPNTQPNLQPDSYYLVSSTKKPNFGSFKKKITATSAMINIIPTKWQPEELKSGNRRTDIWLKVDQFASCLHSVLICHRGKKFHTVFGNTDSQFLFDIKSQNEEVLIDVSQQQLHGFSSIGFSIHRVEMNRESRLTCPSDSLLKIEPEKRRSICTRITLKAGRYILILKSDRDVNFMIRTYNTQLREANGPVTGSFKSLNFLTKSPNYVTRLEVIRVCNLEKTEDLRSLNPYLVLSTNGKEVRSTTCRNTSNPDFGNFSSIFYHSKLKNMTLEVYSQGLLKDTRLGSVSIPLQVRNNDKQPVEPTCLDLKNKSGDVTGSIEIRIETYDDLHKV